MSVAYASLIIELTKPSLVRVKPINSLRRPSLTTMHSGTTNWPSIAEPTTAAPATTTNIALTAAATTESTTATARKPTTVSTSTLSAVATNTQPTIVTTNTVPAVATKAEPTAVATTTEPSTEVTTTSPAVATNAEPTVATTTTDYSTLKSERMLAKDERRQMRITITVAILVVVVIASWTPCFISGLLFALDLPESNKDGKIITIHYFSIMIGVASSCVNPLLYCWRIREVRKAALDIFRKIVTFKLC
eukprot:Seg3105.1 transcript_id=Seg3105.1/GoldUCD/mRNA.D3Y31 product="Sphingosine 1-phosphate receptor 3" protein_id=Seg3105.1/GoldUCD/D3Y31